MNALLLLLAVQDQTVPSSAKAEWFPAGFAYRHPLADPRAPVTGVRLQLSFESEEDIKIENRLATHLSVWRRRDGDHLVEVQAEGAVFGRFDIEENLDMDGADFRFGFPVVYRTGSLAWKLHPWHMTSHLGDEFIERTGRKRIAYARNEIALGLSWDLDAAWRAYVEGGYAVARGDLNEPWRLMAGVETVGRHFGPSWPETFAAVNLTSFEEQDWDVQLHIEAGVWLRPACSERGVRLSLGYFNGPSALTQFFAEHEHYWTFGFALPF